MNPLIMIVLILFAIVAAFFSARRLYDAVSIRDALRAGILVLRHVKIVG